MRLLQRSTSSSALFGLLYLAVACSPAFDVVDDRGTPPLRTVHLELASDPPARVTAAGAWVEPEGAVKAVDVEASVGEPNDASPPLVVEAERSHWKLRERELVFEGSVVARRGPMVLYSARLELLYRDGVVEEAWATGGVRVIAGDREVRSEQARLKIHTGGLDFTGDPEMFEGPNHLRGERILLSLEDETLECERCTLVVDGAAGQPAP